MSLMKTRAGYNYDENGQPEKNSLELFEQVKARIKSKQQMLEDMQNEYALLQQQALHLYSRHVYYWNFMENTIYNARNWMRMEKDGKDADGNKLDRRKKYNEKVYYEILVDEMKRYLGINEIEITSIIQFNHGEANNIEFMYGGHKWYLSVPVIEHIHLDYYKYYGEEAFMLSLWHYDESYVTSLVGHTFEEEKLADIMAEGIKKFCEQGEE